MSALLAELCGVAIGAADHDVLGIGADPTRQEISAAIDARLKLIASHPEGGGKRGVEARTQVVVAARRLMRGALARERASTAGTPGGREARQPAARPIVAGVDAALARELAGILRRGGGWNERSRRRVMAWAAQRGLSPDQLRAAFALVVGHRSRAPTPGKEPTLPQAAMEGLADSIDVVIDSPAKRTTTIALVATGVLLSLAAVLIAYFTLRESMTEGGADASTPAMTADAPARPDSVAAPSGAEHGAPAEAAPHERRTAAPQSPDGQAPVPPATAADGGTTRTIEVHRDARLDGLLKQWERTAASTWEGASALPPVDLVARLERTHAILLAGSLLLEGKVDAAASMLESIPARPASVRVAPALPGAEAPDLALGSALRQAGASTSSRRKALEVFRASAPGRVSREDGAALAVVALGDESPAIRLLAQDMILERFSASPAMALAMVESLPVARDAWAAEARDFIASYLGQPCDLPPSRWAEWATRALAERALAAIQAEGPQVDRLAESLRATVAARAEALGAPRAAAASLLSAEAAGAMVVLQVAGRLPREEQEALRARLQDRLTAADGSPQRFAAAQWSMVDAESGALRARWPRMAPVIDGIVSRASRGRDEAASIFVQLRVDAEALLAIQRAELEVMLGEGGPA